MPITIEYQDKNERINIFFMDHQFSFKPDKLDDESLAELIRGILVTNPKKLNRIMKLLLLNDKDEIGE